MSLPQRLVLVLVLLVAAGAVAVSLLAGDEAVAEPPAASGPGTQAVQEPGPSSAPTRLKGDTGSGGRLSAGGAPAGSLKVQVIDAEGEPLPEAELHLTGPGGEERTAVGPTTWRDLPVGEYRLKASAGELLPFIEMAQVVDGETTSLTARLGASLVLTGRVVDRFGQGVGPMPVWLLRRDQTHPTTLKDGRKLLSALTDSRGGFTAQIERTGQIRLSVGPPGQQLIESAPQRFSSAGPREVTVVVSGTGRLEVVLDPKPIALSSGNVAFGVTVLAQRNAGGDGVRKRRVGSAKRNKKNSPTEKDRNLPGGTSREGAGREEAGREGAEEAPQEPDREVQLIPRAEAEFDRKGVVSFEALPTDRELVLELYRRNDLYRSEPVLLVPDQALIASVAVPMRRTKEEREASDYGELLVSFRQRNLPKDAPPVGITWE